MQRTVRSENGLLQTHLVPIQKRLDTGRRDAEVYVAYAGDHPALSVRFAVERNAGVRGLVVAPRRYHNVTCRGHPRIRFFALEHFNDTRARFDAVFRSVNEHPLAYQYHTFFRWWLLTEMLRRVEMDPNSWVVCVDSDVFVVAPLRPRLARLRAQRGASEGGFFVRGAMLASTSRALVAYCHYHRLLWTHFDAQRVCRIGRIQLSAQGRRRLPGCATYNATHSYRLDDMDVATSFVRQSRRHGWPLWTLGVHRVAECVDVRRAGNVAWSLDGKPDVTRPLCYVHFQGTTKHTYMNAWLWNQMHWS